MQPEAIFRSLAEHEVEYVLVGGLAATAHGASIVTLGSTWINSLIRKLREAA